MAEKRTIDINIKNNADKATKDFNTFNDALDETAKSAKNVNSTFEEVYGELQPLTTRLGEAEDRLYELALAGDTTSKEYQELLTKVGEYRKVQIQTDLAVDGAATTMTQKLGSALNAATSGFAATQGAIALFGQENEALNESLLKVQSALAIQQGVQGLTDAYKELSIGTKLASGAQALFSTVVGGTSGALKVFRVALISTGIGAIVVGLGLLIANFDKVSKFVGNAVKGFDKLGAAMKIILLPITAVIEAFKLVKQGLQAVGVLESDEEKARKERAAAQQKRIAAERKAYEEAYKERLKQIQETSKAEEVAFDRSIRLLESQGKNTIRLRKQRLKQELDEAKQRLELEKRTGGFLVSLYQNLVTERQIAYNDILKEQRQFYKQQRDNAKRDEEKRQKDAQEAFEKALQEEIDFFNENKLPVLQAIADKEVEIQINKYSLMGEALEAQLKKEEALRKRNQDFAVQTTLDGLSLISDITELFGKKGEKQAKKAFQVQKAAQIATATIETYLSAQKAYTSQLIPGDPTSPIRAGIAAGVAVAAGLANVAKIASQKFEGGGSSGGGSDFSGGSVGGGEVAPQFNVVGDANINQLAQLQQQPTQAYVVSGEVTSAQALDRNRVTNATL